MQMRFIAHRVIHSTQGTVKAACEIEDLAPGPMRATLLRTRVTMNVRTPMKKIAVPVFAGLVLAGFGLTATAQAQSAKEMTVFLTSVGPGNGGNLGGIAGADAHCVKLAKAAGSPRTNWHAYLSVKPNVDRSSGRPVMSTGINARDRIGKGPWKNAQGVVIAKSVADLHSSSNKLTIKTALSEQGQPINGRGQKPNRHDILTGSDPQGRYSTAGGDTTCGNWTSSSDKGSAIVGHHDRAGLDTQWSSLSWNSSHGSRGCGAKDLPKSGGDGLFYCFVAN